MNVDFWKRIQKCWRITINPEKKEELRRQASIDAEGIINATLTKQYSNNPLDDFDDEDEGDDDD